MYRQAYPRVPKGSGSLPLSPQRQVYLIQLRLLFERKGTSVRVQLKDQTAVKYSYLGKEIKNNKQTASNCGQKPKCFRISFVFLRSNPCRRAVPADGVNSPESIARVVVFPIIQYILYFPFRTSPGAESNAHTTENKIYNISKIIVFIFR